MRAATRSIAADPVPASRLTRRGDRLCEDDIVLLDATWDDYERMLERRGEHSVPRMAFLDGVVQLVSPGLSHESLKSRVGRLVEVWCLSRRVEFRAGGAWTLRDRRRQAGAEADECYVFGVVRRPRRPHLAIEVVSTSGGLDKLEIHRRLRVREVWFWRRGRLSVHVLRGDRYEERPSSAVLPGIDLGELVTFLDRTTDSQCIRAYAAHLRRTRRAGMSRAPRRR